MSLLSKFTGAVSSGVTGAVDSLHGMWSGTNKTFNKVLEMGKDLGGKAGGVLGKAWDATANVAGKAWEGTKSLAGKAVDGVKEGYHVLKDAGVIDAIGQYAKENAGKIGTIGGALVGGALGVPQIGMAIGGSIGNFVEGGGIERSQMGSQLQTLHRSYKSGDGQFGTNLHNTILSGAQQLNRYTSKKYLGKGRKSTAMAVYVPQGNRPSAKAITYSGGPASNVYNGGQSRVIPGFVTRGR